MVGNVALTLTWTLLVGRTLAVSCYAPNGEDRNAQFNVSNLYYYAPCDPSATHSMCCGWGAGRVEIGNEDTCRSDGLCQADTNIWRESCTDPTWQAPECLKLFMNGTGYQGAEQVILDTGRPLADVLVRKCDDGSWCYGSGNEACCAQGDGVWLNADGEQVGSRPGGISTTLASGTTSITSTSATNPANTLMSSISTGSLVPGASATSEVAATATPKPSDEGLSTGAQAGIGAAVGGAALFALIGLGYWLRKRRKVNLANQPDSKIIQEAPDQHGYVEAPVEVGENVVRHELDSHGSSGPRSQKHTYSDA